MILIYIKKIFVTKKSFKNISGGSIVFSANTVLTKNGMVLILGLFLLV